MLIEREVGRMPDVAGPTSLVLAAPQKMARRAAAGLGAARRRAAGLGAARRRAAGLGAARRRAAGLGAARRRAAGLGAARRGPAGKAAGAGPMAPAPPKAPPTVLPPTLAATPLAGLGTKEAWFCSAAGAAGTGVAAAAGRVAAVSTTAGSTLVCGTTASFTAAGTTGMAGVSSRLSRTFSVRGVEASSTAAGAALFLDGGAGVDSSPEEGCSAASRRAIKKFWGSVVGGWLWGSVVGGWLACVSSPVSEGLGAPALSLAPEARASSVATRVVGANRARRSGAASAPASAPLSSLALPSRNGAPESSSDDSLVLSVFAFAALASLALVSFVAAPPPPPPPVPAPVSAALVSCLPLEPAASLDPPIRAWQARGTSKASRRSPRRTARILRLV